VKKAFIFPISFLIFTQLIAVAVAPSFLEMGFTAFEDPEASTNVIFLIVLFPLVLIVMVLLLRRNRKRVLNTLLLFAIFLAMTSVIFVLMSSLAGEAISAIIALSLSATLLYLMTKRKSWLIADICGFVLAVGITAMLGVSLTPMLMAVLLVALSLYDFVSVYMTRHMVSMAEGVIDLSLPVLLIFPDNPGQFRLEERGNSGEPSAFFLGLGDIVLPSGYVVSLSVFSDPRIALFAAIGTIAGVIFLLVATLKTKANAGLPFLCSFAIIFSLIGYVLL
jgi:presenilin-like A22 family membrane protease